MRNVNHALRRSDEVMAIENATTAVPTNSMTGDKERRSRAMRRFAYGMALYAAIVVVEGLLFRPGVTSAWLGVALAMAPMAAAIWAMVNWLEAVRTFDELQQKIFSEAGLI